MVITLLCATSAHSHRWCNAITPLCRHRAVWCCRSEGCLECVLISFVFLWARGSTKAERSRVKRTKACAHFERCVLDLPGAKKHTRVETVSSVSSASCQSGWGPNTKIFLGRTATPSFNFHATWECRKSLSALAKRVLTWQMDYFCGSKNCSCAILCRAKMWISG